MSKSRHIQRKDGEAWTLESHKPFQLTCCDCGLAHTLVLTTEKEGEAIGIAAKRDNRTTAQLRRHRNYEKK